MVDSLGYRMTFGVVAPSTNTAVQPEFEAMRPVGVTNHFSRIVIPNNPIGGDDDFQRLIDNIRASLMDAVDSVMTCSPDHIIMGVSAETFWDGLQGSTELQARLEERSGRKATMGSDACRAALKAYGNIRRVAVLTPYMPIADNQVRRFLADCGYEVVALKGLKCASPIQMAQIPEATLRDAIKELNDPSVEAILQVGTNLAMARVAAIAEFWLEKPVIAVNTATYWWALRQSDIKDRIQGYGSLLANH